MPTSPTHRRRRKRIQCIPSPRNLRSVRPLANDGASSSLYHQTRFTQKPKNQTRDVTTDAKRHLRHHETSLIDTRAAPRPTHEPKTPTRTTLTSNRTKIMFTISAVSQRTTASRTVARVAKRSTTERRGAAIVRRAESTEDATPSVSSAVEEANAEWKASNEAANVVEMKKDAIDPADGCVSRRARVCSFWLDEPCHPCVTSPKRMGGALY